MSRFPPSNFLDAPQGIPTGEFFLERHFDLRSRVVMSGLRVVAEVELYDVYILAQPHLSRRANPASIYKVSDTPETNPTHTNETLILRMLFAVIQQLVRVIEIPAA